MGLLHSRITQNASPEAVTYRACAPDCSDNVGLIVDTLPSNNAPANDVIITLSPSTQVTLVL